MAKLPAEDPKAGAPEWMCTFADMMSLLLTFFILLISFSTIEIKKFQSAAESIRNAFGSAVLLEPNEGRTGARPISLPVPVDGPKLQEHPDNRTVAQLRNAIEKTRMTDRASVEITDRGVVLRMADDALFESGQADLKGSALELIREVVAVAATSPGAIEIEGHTDDVPIASGRYPSNWELSAARAGSAVRYLTAEGIPARRLKAIGYADTKPLTDNDSPEHRSKNRRIEVLFVQTARGASPAGEGIPR